MRSSIGATGEEAGDHPTLRLTRPQAATISPDREPQGIPFARPGGICEAAKVTIQDLGSIGEFVAAIATIAYLALQIRQNTRTLRVNSHQEAGESWASLNYAIANHSDFADIFVRSLDARVPVSRPTPSTRSVGR